MSSTKPRLHLRGATTGEDECPSNRWMTAADGLHGTGKGLLLSFYHRHVSAATNSTCPNIVVIVVKTEESHFIVRQFVCCARACLATSKPRAVTPTDLQMAPPDKLASLAMTNGPAGTRRSARNKGRSIRADHNSCRTTKGKT